MISKQTSSFPPRYTLFKGTSSNSFVEEKKKSPPFASSFIYLFSSLSFLSLVNLFCVPKRNVLGSGYWDEKVKVSVPPEGYTEEQRNHKGIFQAFVY